MATVLTQGAPPSAPRRGELRYALELARLMGDRTFVWPSRAGAAPPVLLVPGFMAGDASMSVLGGWLRRRGSRTAGAGIRMNIDCTERAVGGIESRLQRLASRAGEPVVVIGQSRGGALARVLAVRNPELVSTVVMLGTPVLDPLGIDAMVLGAVRSVARLGDLGIPRMFSSDCADGDCCERARDELTAPLPDGIRMVSVYSRTDAVVAWEACLDPYGENVEVGSSHCGMSVNVEVFRVLERVLDGARVPGADELELSAA